MKKIPYVLLVFIWLPLLAFGGQVRYVTPKAEIPLRSGKGTDYRIIAVVQDGEQVTVLEEEGYWARIKRENGVEGWIMKRFLSETPPPSQLLQGLRSEKSRLSQKIASLQQELAISMNKGKECKSRLTECVSERNNISRRYNSLKADSANVMTLRDELQNTSRDLEIVKQQLESAMAENKILRKNDRIRWFMAGASVLLAGWLIGLIMGRGKRKRPSLLD